MTAVDTVTPDLLPAERGPEPADARGAAVALARLRGGWRIVAAKEFGDHLRSVRFGLL